MANPTNERPAARKRKKKRGGARPGAGAPKGNLNALKHGGYSMQYAALGAIVASNPKIRDALIALGDRHDLKRKKAEDVALDLFSNIMRHAGDVAAGRTRKPLLPDDLQSLSD